MLRCLLAALLELEQLLFAQFSCLELQRLGMSLVKPYSKLLRKEAFLHCRLQMKAKIYLQRPMDLCEIMTLTTGSVKVLTRNY